MTCGVRIATIVLATFLSASAACAQQAGGAGADDQEGPSTELPAMPQLPGTPNAAASAQAAKLAAAGEKAGIPALPPSRPCVPRDLLGIWHLLSVYEEPRGTETALMASSPHQYYVFDRDSTYGRLNAGINEMPPRVVRDAIKQQNTALHQYVLDQNGMLFFYQDSIAIDTLACFIVANSRTPFEPGEMLLLPPEGQSATRLIKVYEKVRRGVFDRGYRGRPSAAIYKNG